MITIVLLVVSLIIAGVMIFKGISNDDTVSLRNGIIVGVLGIIISLVQPFHFITYTFYLLIILHFIF